MQYYVRFDSDPESETYLENLSLHRQYHEGSILMLERFDPASGEWVDNPGLIAASGVGGAANYNKISGKEAAKVLEGWGFSKESM